MPLLSTLYHGVCPACRKGFIFKTLMKMNPRCPVCDLLFDREPGYFLGAMMISYAISAALCFLIYGVLKAKTVYPLPILIFGIFLIYLPTVPFVFRYSRMVWIYFDNALDPQNPA